MIITRKATQEDMDFIRLNPLEEAVKQYPICPIDDLTTVSLYNGVPFAIGGLRPVWKGVAEAWVIMTKEVLKFKVEALWKVREEMDRMIAESDYKRIMAIVRVDLPQAIKMIEFMGFENETPNGMKSFFSDGCDAYMYSRGG